MWTPMNQRTESTTPGFADGIELENELTDSVITGELLCRSRLLNSSGSSNLGSITLTASSGKARAHSIAQSLTLSLSISKSFSGMSETLKPQFCVLKLKKMKLGTATFSASFKPETRLLLLLDMGLHHLFWAEPNHFKKPPACTKTQQQAAQNAAANAAKEPSPVSVAFHSISATLSSIIFPPFSGQLPTIQMLQQQQQTLLKIQVSC